MRQITEYDLEGSNYLIYDVVNDDISPMLDTEEQKIRLKFGTDPDKIDIEDITFYSLSDEVPGGYIFISLHHDVPHKRPSSDFVIFKRETNETNKTIEASI
jgi:hypothetical protein